MLSLELLDYMNRGTALGAVLYSDARARGTMPGQRYLLKTPTLAIASQDRQRRPLKYSIRLLGSTTELIPPGAVLKVIDGPLYGNRLIDVEWDGRTVMMFTTDIRERCEQLDDEVQPPRER